MHGWACFLIRVPKFCRRTICGRDEKWVAESAKKYGWESYETSWERLVERDDIDIIDITAPSNAHKEIAIAAAKNGKHIFCEKAAGTLRPTTRAICLRRSSVPASSTK